jgi:hypothetical protein
MHGLVKRRINQPWAASWSWQMYIQRCLAHLLNVEDSEVRSIVCCIILSCDNSNNSFLSCRCRSWMKTSLQRLIGMKRVWEENDEVVVKFEVRAMWMSSSNSPLFIDHVPDLKNNNSKIEQTDQIMPRGNPWPLPTVVASRQAISTGHSPNTVGTTKILLVWYAVVCFWCFSFTMHAALSKICVKKDMWLLNYIHQIWLLNSIY